MENLPKISVIVLFTLFFAGSAFADVDRVSGTLLAVANLIKEALPVITMTCLVISAILYSSCNLNMGSEIRKQFVMAAQGFLTISVVAVVLTVVMPPVIDTIYKGPAPSDPIPCAASADCGAGIDCISTRHFCCTADKPFYCGPMTGYCAKNAASC